MQVNAIRSDGDAQRAAGRRFDVRCLQAFPQDVQRLLHGGFLPFAQRVEQVRPPVGSPRQPEVVGQVGAGGGEQRCPLPGRVFGITGRRIRSEAAQFALDRQEQVAPAMLQEQVGTGAFRQ